MNRLARTLDQVATLLDLRGIRWALVGGLAVSARAEPRFTRDIDVAIAVAADQEAEQLIHSLTQQGFALRALVEQEAVGRLATARLLPPTERSGGVVVDLLFGSSGIEAEIVKQSERIEVFTSLSLPVARAPHLLALKILARDDRTRPQDLIDIASLWKCCSAEELQATREALRLIVSRGYHRGRDLLTHFLELQELQAHK